MLSIIRIRQGVVGIIKILKSDTEATKFQQIGMNVFKDWCLRCVEFVCDFMNVSCRGQSISFSK